MSYAASSTPFCRSTLKIEGRHAGYRTRDRFLSKRAGSISRDTPGLIQEIIAAGGGNGTQNISAEQWVSYYRQVIATDPWQQAIARMQASAGTDSYNLWQWAWFWQRSVTFTGAPAGFGVLGSIDNTAGLIGNIVAAGGGNGLAMVSAQQWVQYYRQATSQ